MQANISVFKYNPDKEDDPSFQDYSLKIKKGETVLDILRRIRDDEDGSLVYRSSCRAAICGSCAMRINKNSKLACNTQVEDEIEKHGKLVVEPMRNMKVVKEGAKPIGAAPEAKEGEAKE